VKNSRVEINAFLKELYKFEHDLPYDPAVIEARYQEMIRSFLVKNEPLRPVYVTPEIEQEFTGGLQKVPSGLAFRIYPDTTYREITPRDFAFHPITKSDKYSEAIRNLYAGAYCRQGIYLAIREKRDKALESFRKALQVTPGFPEAFRWLRQLGVEP
jgi:tetratricopeptide (TPR) repeat protein